MPDPNLLRYGKSEPLLQRVPLRAGSLSLIYEDGDIRYIKCGEYELVRRIYGAVRDQNWGTVLPTYSDFHMDVAEDCFRITYQAVNQSGDIHFTWRGLIQGEDGILSFHMEGQAITTFMKNRIGLCLLLPASLAGQPCSVIGMGGRLQLAFFPAHITPDQPPLPFTDLTGMVYPVGLVQVAIAYEGDLFEMEDQRNWSDASFKTFCPPLRYPYPNIIAAGAKISQTITLQVEQKDMRTRSKRKSREGLTFEIGDHPVGRLPSLGTSIASHGGDLAGREVELLRQLELSHLRVDLWLSNPHCAYELRRATAQSHLLDVPLYLAMHISENGEEELKDFAAVFRELNPPVALWLVYPAKEAYLGGSPTAQVVEWVKNSSLVRQAKSTVPLASGTDADFIFLQRNLPPFDQVEAVCFALNPQVHTFDNASLVETLEAQAMLVADARRLSTGQRVVVSPVTLRPRYNPYASAAIPVTPAGQLPPQVDYRQPSLFAAAWLVGSLRAFALGGASAATYFETTGWRGIMETEAGSPMPGLFHSSPGRVFPIYHIFAAVAGYKTAEVLLTKSNYPLKIQGLALRKGELRRILVANLSPDEQVVTVMGISRQVSVRQLDETQFENATCNPDVFRAQPPTIISRLVSGYLELALLPYAVATLDLE